MPYENVWRLGVVKNIATASAGGASNSTTAVGSQTYAVRINDPGSDSSTGGVRIAIGTTPSASSTADALICPGDTEIFKISPGEKVAAISNDAGVPIVTIVELSK